MKYFLIKDKLNLIALLIIVLLAAALRIWQITGNPPSLFVDEVSNGYNTYSILKTGRDEYGNFMPLTFRAFGDYNPALSVYLLVPTIAIFGLNEYGVRLPSAILGILIVLIVYVLALEIFQNKKIALFSSLLLAISPWHLQFSRYDHEANFMLFFSVLGITLFLSGIKKHTFLIFSAISFAFALNSYHAAKIWVPLIIIATIFIYRKELSRAKANLVIPSTIIIISALPIFLNFKNSLIRGQSVSILNNEKAPLEVFIRGYLSHLSPNFLFVQGDPIGRHSVKGIGQLYVFEAPLILIGLISLIKIANKSQNQKLLLGWFLVAPIPAALAIPTPHALRAIALIPAISLITAYGLFIIINSQVGKIKKVLILAAISTVASYNIITYFHLYYIHEPNIKSPDWSYGYKQAINFIESIREDNQIIAFTNYYGHPYIYVLFYTKHDPKSYQLDQNKERVGGYEFFGENWEKPNNEKAILARAPWQVTYNPNLKILKSIHGPSGEVFFVITEE